MNRDRVLIILAIVMVAAAAVIYFAKRPTTEPPEAQPAAIEPGAVDLVVVGVRALDPELVARFSEQGRLPNLTRLMEDGAYGPLDGLGRGTAPEVNWTSLVTGMLPENQGVGGKVESPRGGLIDAPLVPASRTVDTIWTLLAGEGESVGVVCWPGLWPVEQIEGSVLIGPYSRIVVDRVHDADPEKWIYPPSEIGLIQTLMPDPSVTKRRDLAGFIDLSAPQPYEKLVGQNYETLAHSYTGDSSTLAIGMRITGDPGVDHLLVCLEGLDGVCQRFWHYMEPESVLDGAQLDDEGRERLLEQADALEVVIPTYYEFLDKAIGALTGLVGPDGTVAVVSEHGYRGVMLDRAGNPQVGTAMHSETGYFVIAGPAVDSGVRVEGARLIDFAPTLMAAAGIEPAVDTDGRVLSEALR